MIRCLALLGLAVVLSGCSPNAPNTETSQATMPEPVFQGKPAEKRITWDLSGIWSVSRFGTKENPGKLGRWEAKWTLRRASRQVWDDEVGHARFLLNAVPVGNSDIAEMLVWERPDGTNWYFSINEQSFGFLLMTGDDGEQYMAVRSD